MNHAAAQMIRKHVLEMAKKVGQPFRKSVYRRAKRKYTRLSWKEKTKINL